jgi:hypothetical protein
MRRIVFLILIGLPLFAGSKRIWNQGNIALVDTNLWCGKPLPAVPHVGSYHGVGGNGGWPGICGAPGGFATIQFPSYWGGPPQPNPTTQILEIDGADATYIVKRQGLDGGLRLRANAVTEYSLDKKHLLIRFPGTEQEKVEILEIRAK